MDKIAIDPLISLPKSTMIMAMSHIFRGLPIEYSYANLANIGISFYEILFQINPKLYQKFLLLSHYHFFLSKIFGNYKTGSRAQFHDKPTMLTINVVQYIRANFFRPIPITMHELPPQPLVSLSRFCSILEMITPLLEKNQSLAELGSSLLIKIMLRCAAKNFENKKLEYSLFGLKMKELYFYEINNQMIWQLANHDGLLSKIILDHMGGHMA